MKIFSARHIMLLTLSLFLVISVYFFLKMKKEPISMILPQKTGRDYSQAVFMPIPSCAWQRDIAAGGYIDGAPVGGFGAGTITMNYNGTFYKGRLDIGSNDRDTDSSCGFYIYQKPAGHRSSVKRLTGDSLGPDQAKYYALFPKSWVDYYGPDFTVKARMKQFSPIIPNDYQRSSYPVGIYIWELYNPSDAPCEAGIMLAWNNDFGGSYARTFQSGDMKGIILGRKKADNAATENQGEFTIAAQGSTDVIVTCRSASNTNKIKSDFSDDGELNNKTGNDSKGAAAFKINLAPGEIARIPVVLAWDIPVTGTSNRWYREYTRYFGRSGLNSQKIAEEALNNYKAWEKSVDAWQNEIINNPKYPDWLKTSMFNELYYYFAGGTIWEAGAASGQPDDPNENMFSHLECFEYLFYGTSDVRFYGSWPLILYWPELDKQAVRQFSDSVVNHGKGRPDAIGTCAHDFGSVNTVFRQWNAYGYRDSTQWKDLNSKLVLMVYRDWELTGKSDKAFLDYCFDSVKKSMDDVEKQDVDGDGLPDSNGIDQTYDDMDLFGNTAYCGSLFLAACLAAKEIAIAENDSQDAEKYGAWYEKGKRNFESKLWNGSYYRIDTGSKDTERIMSDQLCGEWYAKATGLGDILDSGRVKSSLEKIYEYNFKKFDNGQHGVVNVMLSSGKIDTASMQTREMWIGTAWSVVAAMYQEGLPAEANEIGYSLYNTIYNKGEFQFRTPEAFQTGLSNVRAPYYMRANAVWAVKHAIDISVK